MTKLQKKMRTIEAEFDRSPVHTKEFCHYCGIKTWMKKRHFKASEQRETEYPTHDMDGSTFHPDTGPYNYITPRSA